MQAIHQIQICRDIRCQIIDIKSYEILGADIYFVWPEGSLDAF
jgi:hypothetical protein